MSDEVKALNPELASSEFSLPGKPREDKKYLFADAWKKYAPETAPNYLTEFPFNKPDSKHRFDFAFLLPHLLAVEIDGGEWVAHGGRHASELDKIKMNLAAVAGYRVMHFSPSMLENDPIGCISLVLEALNANLGG